MRKYTVPFLLASYLLAHMYSTQFLELSPWKGGGFGMYSTYHPSETNIWFELGKERIHSENLQEERQLPGFKRQLQICKTLPSEYQLRKLLTLIQTDNLEYKAVEVWMPRFDVKKSTLKMELVSRVE